MNADLTPRISFGSAASISQLLSDTSVRCRVVAGAFNSPLVVSVASGTGSLSGLLSYTSPIQSSIEFSVVVSTGSVSITVM